MLWGSRFGQMRMFSYFMMTIFDNTFWWQFSYFRKIFRFFETWHLRHWLHCCQLRTTLLTITLWPLNKEWQGQHSQFLGCFGNTFAANWPTPWISEYLFIKILFYGNTQLTGPFERGPFLPWMISSILRLLLGKSTFESYGKIVWSSNDVILIAVLIKLYKLASNLATSVCQVCSQDPVDQTKVRLEQNW